MWVHRLSNKNIENKTATCSNCGPVKIKRLREGQYRCRKAIAEYRRRSDNPGICDLCGGFRRVAYDHDHKTGKHRGWLCMKCNTALGLVGDNIELLQRMIDYLKREPN